MIKLFSSADALIDMIHATVATIHQEINGEYSCQVQADYDLQAGQIVELEDANGAQKFRLEKPVKNMETSTAFGWHITQDLAKDIITDREWSGTGSDVWPDIVQAGISERRFTGTSNISTVASSRMVRRSVLASMIGGHETSFLSRWGGELERDNYTVNMLNRLGADNGYQVLFGKNLTAFEATIDESQIVNRIIPTFLGASGGTLLLPEVYIDSPRINQTPVPHCMSIHYGDIQVGAEVDEVIPYPTLASAQAEVRNRIEQLYLHGADQPLLTVEIGFAELRNTEEYKNYAWLETVSLGDDVRLEYESYTVDDRVIAYDWDALRKEYTQIVLGKMKPSLDAMTASIATQVASESAVNLQRHVTSLVLAIAELNQSVANASGMFSTKINNADGSFVLYYHDSPTLETSQVIEYYPEPGTRVWTDAGWNEGLPTWKYGYDQHGLLVVRMISTVGLNADWINAGTILAEHIQIGSGSTFAEGYDPTAIEVGGRNLLSNTEGPFEVIKTNTAGYYDAIHRQTINIPDGKEYILSFKAKASAPMVLYSYFYNPNTTTRAESSTGYISTESDGTALTNITTEWDSYWIKWNQSQTGAPKAVIIARILDTFDNILLEIKEIKLEKGNKATDWTPAPEDVSTEIATRTAEVQETARIAAEDYANAQKALTDATAKAYADGVLTTAENKAITEASNALYQANQNLNTATTNLQNFVLQHVSDETAEIKSYIRSNASGNLEIGSISGASKLVQSPTAMTFLVGSIPVATFGAGETDMPKAGVDTELRIGDKASNYHWVSDPDGGMSLIWK